MAWWKVENFEKKRHEALETLARYKSLGEALEDGWETPFLFWDDLHTQYVYVTLNKLEGVGYVLEIAGNGLTGYDDYLDISECGEDVECAVRSLEYYIDTLAEDAKDNEEEGDEE